MKTTAVNPQNATSASSHIYLRLTGIPGEGTETGYENTIGVYSVSWRTLSSDAQTAPFASSPVPVPPRLCS